MERVDKATFYSYNINKGFPPKHWSASAEAGTVIYTNSAKSYPVKPSNSITCINSIVEIWAQVNPQNIGEARMYRLLPG